MVVQHNHVPNCCKTCQGVRQCSTWAAVRGCLQAQLAERENQLSQAQKAAAAAATEVQLARDGLAAAQREKKEELAALRQQHEVAVEQVSDAAVPCRSLGFACLVLCHQQPSRLNNCMCTVCVDRRLVHTLSIPVAWCLRCVWWCCGCAAAVHAGQGQGGQ